MSTRNVSGMRAILSGRLGKMAVGVVWVLALLSLVASCGNSQAPAASNAPASSSASVSPSTKPAASSAAPSGDQAPYKVGLVTAFSGARAETMQNIVNAVRLTTEMVNNEGGINGHKVQLIEYDNEEDPQKSIPVFKRVIEEDKVVAIIGPGINAAIQAIKPLVKDGPIVSLMSASGKPEADSYLFQSTLTQPMLQRMMMEYFKKNNYDKIALLATTDATGEDAVKNIDGIAKSIGGIDVVVERYNASDVDVTPQLTKIRSDKSIKAAVIWSTGKQAATPIQNAAQLGLQIPMVVSMGNHSNGFLKLIQGAAPPTLWMATERGTAWNDLPDSDPIKPVAKAFAAAYKAKFNEQADFSALNGYDSARLVYDALKAAGPDSKKMKEWIESQSNWIGAGLEHSFSKTNHEGDQPQGAVLVQIDGMNWKLAK